MKKLYLTLGQAESLGSDLIEYSKMKDKSDRELYKGFILSFGDLFERELRPGEGFEMTPVPEFTQIEDNE